MPDLMTALVAEGGPTWAVRELPVPAPGPAQVLVRAHAVAIGNADLAVLQAATGAPGTTPAGYDLAGVVAAVGAEVPDGPTTRVGARVMAASPGDIAQYVLVDHRHLLPTPPGLEDVQAAALPTGLNTEYGALRLARFSAGRSVLVTAATSTIGLLGVQIATALGASSVIATTRTSRKVDVLTGVGADVVVATEEQDLTEAVLAATGGAGVDVVLDHVGGEVLAACVPATRTHGDLVNIGRLGPSVCPVDLDALSYRNLRLQGVSYGFTDPDELGDVVAAVTADVLPAVADGRVRPLLDSVLDFPRAREAADRMRDSSTSGKVVMTVP